MKYWHNAHAPALLAKVEILACRGRPAGFYGPFSTFTDAKLNCLKELDAWSRILSTTRRRIQQSTDPLKKE